MLPPVGDIRQGGLWSWTTPCLDLTRNSLFPPAEKGPFVGTMLSVPAPPCHFQLEGGCPQLVPWGVSTMVLAQMPQRAPNRRRG